ncbi:MAG: U32 family peptidase [Lentisphaeria bacterium]
MTTNLPELNAPAGDFIALKAAIENGCNAVYCGLQELNMRAQSNNFNSTDFPQLQELCQARGVKLYLTLNTIVFNPEIRKAKMLLKSVAPYVDAVICWDPAVIEVCRRLNLPIHISTQASVANSSSAIFYREMGAKRITLARECSLSEIETIKRQSKLEIETFVHGAMCMSLSGRCFLSQTFDGKSANRGKCLQPCRREYLFRDKSAPDRELKIGSNYILSARDLCTLPFLDKLVEAGIDAFKIEGRGKSPHYTATVTRCYRSALNAIQEGKFTEELKTDLLTELRKVYNRGFSNGFYFNRPISDFSETGGSQATEKKLYVGVVQNYYAHPSVAEIHVQSNGFKVGDKLLVEGTSTGSLTLIVNEIRRDNQRIDKAEREIITIKTPQLVRRNDKVYVLRSGICELTAKS